MVDPGLAAAELQKALLNSVSHNLRAPLASITGVLDSLIEDRDLLDEETQRELLRSARDEAGRLNRLVGNLLDMTRLEGGAIRLNTEPHDLRDVIGAAVAQLGARLSPGQVSIDFPLDLPLISLDFALITQTLVNLIDNALKYSDDGLPVEVSAALETDAVRISVADRGRGIAEKDLPRVFEKFYSGALPGAGLGLGLSICRGFVDAHGGSIQARNREQGGAVIMFTLPLKPVGGVR
jgi:two-component system, OmpR family, sensor histidine kinase KdpD